MSNIGRIFTGGVEIVQNTIQKNNIQSIISRDEFSSKNLFRFLKKKLHSTGEICEFLTKLSDEEKYIGELPDKWRQKFSGADLGDITKQIQHLFSAFAREAHCEYKVKSDKLLKKAEKLSKSLEKILGEKCIIQYLSKGHLGKVFRIRCAGEDLALKIFHSNPPTDLLSFHGQTKEIANAVALNYCLKPNQCARFYCGKVTFNYAPDAFMLSQFVQNRNKKSGINEKIGQWVYKKFHFGDISKKGNVINGKITDFGAVSYTFNNPIHQKIAKELYPLILNGDNEAIIKLKKKYSNDENFKKFIEGILRIPQKILKNPILFANKVSNGFFQKAEITAFKVLGLDFSVIENHKFSDISNEIIQKMRNLGLSIMH